MARCFLAVRPPAAARAAIVELQRELDDQVRLVPPEQLHVTLRFWDDVEPADVVAALAGAQLPAATARVGPGLEPLGAGAIVLPVSGLDRLAAAVAHATRRLGPEEQRPFVGHLTVARRRGGRTPPTVPIALAFGVREVELVTSRLGPGGASHHRVARWPVPEPAD